MGELNHSSDPQAKMDQVVEQLQTEMAEVRVKVSEYLATVNEFRKRSEDLARLAEKRETEALAALRTGNEDVAKRALTEQSDLLKRAAQAKQVWEQAEEAAAKLRMHLEDLEFEEMQLQKRRDELTARSQTAQLDRRLSDLASGVDGRARSFEVAEEQVTRLEIEAEAHREVAHMNDGDSDDGAGSAEGSIDAKLEELRRRLGTPSKPE